MNTQIFKNRFSSYRTLLAICLLGCSMLSILVWKQYVIEDMPDKILLYQGEKQKIIFPIPVSVQMQLKTQEKESNDANEIVPVLSPAVEKSERSELVTPLIHALSMTPQKGMTYQMKVSAFGVLPMREVSVQVVSPKSVTLSGQPIGIFMRTEGVLVIDTGEFVDLTKQKVSPAKDILQSGDYILKINGQKVDEKKDVTTMIQNCNGKALVFTIERMGEISDVVMTPLQDEGGLYKVGVWVRDSAQGIGTVTYMTKEGEFGALGHGITDTDTQTIMHLSMGSVYDTKILAITKGEDGVPGQLTGMISFEKDDYLGKICKNTDKGVFGEITQFEKGKNILTSMQKEYPVALKQEVEKGAAKVYCNIDGKPEFYDIRIDRFAYHGGEDNRDIMLTITDERLIQMTGGIVQGMSGSPIVQNGKIIGAVTHVFVNQPTKGYGIFIEEMLDI